MDRILVDCPACGGLAVIAPTEPPKFPDKPAYDIDFLARRMTCTACGKVREQAHTAMGALANPTMGLPLRMRAQTRHGDLLAWNEAHLDYIETWLSGTLREETRPSGGGVRNRSIVSRLPAWAKAARNRDELLKAIAKARLKARPGG